METTTPENKAKAARIHSIVNMLLELDDITLDRMEQALRMHLETDAETVIIRDR